MKKIRLGIIFILFCFVCVLGYQFFFAPVGNTVESRQAQLNKSIAKGESWTIVKELTVEDTIISAASSSDGKAALAIFEPVSNRGYQFVSSTNRNQNEIIISGASIQGNWYDLIWFDGAQTDHAQIIYTINDTPQKPLLFDTNDMDIICIQNKEKEYNLSVTYYDQDGNAYT